MMCRRPRTRPPNSWQKPKRWTYCTPFPPDKNRGRLVPTFLPAIHFHHLRLRCLGCPFLAHILPTLKKRPPIHCPISVHWHQLAYQAPNLASDAHHHCFCLASMHRARDLGTPRLTSRRWKTVPSIPLLLSFPVGLLLAPYLGLLRPWSKKRFALTAAVRTCANGMTTTRTLGKQSKICGRTRSMQLTRDASVRKWSSVLLTAQVYTPGYGE